VRPICEILEDRTTPSMVWGDFNGDGFKDLAVGNPNATVNGIANAGDVTVYWGSASGISDANKTILTKFTVDPTMPVEPGDRFGFALAAGDLRHSGYDDLVIGNPYDSLSNTAPGIGIVNIVNGGANGLDVANSRVIYQGLGEGAQHAPHPGDLNGYALAIGDFNGDGYLDLAVGSPGNRTHTPTQSIQQGGMFLVYYGTANGIPTQDIAYSLGGSAQTGEFLSWSFAVGDFNGDGYADLAVGIPYRSVNGVTAAGSVAVWYGSASGLATTSAGRQMFSQGVNGIKGTAQTNGNFGWSLAAGDFNHDGFSDLAIGAPGDNGSAGTVNIIYGSASRLTKTGNQLWTQDTVSNGVASQAGAGFGTALTVGDFNNDGFADLVIGAPNQTVNALSNAGAVDVLYGSSGSLSATGSQFWSQSSLNDGLASQANAQFGSSLAAGDGNGDHFADLGIEAPGESLNGVANADLANVMYSASRGLGGSGNQFWYAGPLAPGNLSANPDVDTNGNFVRVQWTDTAADATGYQIERSLDGSNFSTIATTGGGATSFTDRNVSPNTYYWYRVHAFNGAGQSLPVVIETLTAPPAAPTNLQGGVTASTQVTLTWKDNSVNETAFAIERSTDGVNFTLINWAPTNATSFTDSGLTAGATYYYRVKATGTLADSGYTNVVAITVGTPVTPAAPSNLTASATGRGQINLTWTDNSNNESGFKIYRSLDGSTWTLINTVGVNVTSYSDPGLASGTMYFYRVKSFNGAGTSAYSNTAKTTSL
jgi:hypothetical protein